MEGARKTFLHILVLEGAVGKHELAEYLLEPCNRVIVMELDTQWTSQQGLLRLEEVLRMIGEPSNEYFVL
jgi:hypothetical protein